jgi:hypothetical protein
MTNKPDVIAQAATGIKKFFLWAIIAGIGLSIFAAIVADKKDAEQADAEQARRTALTPDQRKKEDDMAAKIAAQKKAADDLFAEKSMALLGCNELIKAAAKDPSSIEFLYYADDAPIKKRKKGGFDVQQRVRAKNSFGALTVNTVDCRVTNTNGQWQGRIVRTF